MAEGDFSERETRFLRIFIPWVGAGRMVRVAVVASWDSVQVDSTMDAHGRTAVSVGDWVETHSPGIWRVFRIERGFYEFRYRVGERKRISRRTLVFAKRLFDQNWKKSFATEVNDITTVTSLRDDEIAQAVAKANPALLAEFLAWEPEGLDFMMALRFNFPPPVELDGIRKAVLAVFAGIESSGLSNDDILRRIAESHFGQLQADGISNVTIRFLCRNYELRDGEFVFRAVDVLGIG